MMQMMTHNDDYEIKDFPITTKPNGSVHEM